jgi:hypothetical protein
MPATRWSSARGLQAQPGALGHRARGRGLLHRQRRGARHPPPAVRDPTLEAGGIEVAFAPQDQPGLPADPRLPLALDRAREAPRPSDKIGTTGKGIGPTYEDKVARRALRVYDLFDPERFAAKLKETSSITTSC